MPERLIPAVTGYDASMVRIELKRYMRMFRRRELLRFVDDELNCPQMLDEYRPNRSGGYTRLYRSGIVVPRVFQQCAGHSSVEHDDGSADEKRDSRQIVVRRAADAGAVRPFPGKRRPRYGGRFRQLCLGVAAPWIEDAAIGEADAVVAYGSSHTTEAIRPRVRAGKPFLSYGAKIGFSLIGREALRADLYAGTVHHGDRRGHIQRQSCLAPQTMFVERGGAMSPAQVAELLASELDGQQRKYPRSTPSEEESMAIQRLRSTAQMKALMLGAGPMAAAAGNADDAPSDDPFVVQSRSGTDWTVLYYPSIGMADSLSTPLNRTVNIVAVDHVEDALAHAAPLRAMVADLRCGARSGPAVRRGATRRRDRHRPHLPGRRDESREIRLASRRRLQSA